MERFDAIMNITKKPQERIPEVKVKSIVYSSGEIADTRLMYEKIKNLEKCNFHFQGQK